MPNKTKPLTIALLTNGIYPITIGGMQKHSYYLAKNLAKLGVFVDLYYMPLEDQKKEQLLIEENFAFAEREFVNFIPIKWPRERRYPGHYIVENYIYSKIIFKQLISRAPNYSFIYAKGFSAWYLLRMKRKGMDLPRTGVKFHGYEMYQISPSLRYSFEKLLLKWPVKWNNTASDYVFSYGGKISGIIKNLGINEMRIVEIPTGIEALWLNNNLIKNQTNKPIQFVFTGRYERRKGIQELNQCIEQIHGKYDFIFHFIGPIPIEKQIKSDKIIYHGTIMDQGKIKHILQQSDILVCPSYSEGMPNVIMEAMASGCAIIASDVGAVSEQVDASNGILIRPGDKKQLKAAIEKMITLPGEQLLAMKKASIKRIEEKFLWERVAEQTITEIKRIIEEH